jgi:hypothetical protein
MSAVMQVVEIHYIGDLPTVWTSTKGSEEASEDLALAYEASEEGHEITVTFFTPQ